MLQIQDIIEFFIDYKDHINTYQNNIGYIILKYTKISPLHINIMYNTYSLSDCYH